MKRAIWGGMSIGSLLGGWALTQFGASVFSFARLIGSAIAGLAGVAAVPDRASARGIRRGAS